MAALVRPTFQAIVDQALASTGAATGWLLGVTDDRLEVLATGGLAAANHSIGESFPATGAQGYVLSSGQPAALMPQPSDPANDGAGGFSGVPTSVLAAPCGTQTVLGVLELAAKEGSNPFTFDDIEAVSLLASVGGAAMLEDGGTADEVASPSELAAELTQLAEKDPRRYADTARLIESILGQGS